MGSIPPLGCCCRPPTVGVSCAAAGSSGDEFSLGVPHTDTRLHNPSNVLLIRGAHIYRRARHNPLRRECAVRAACWSLDINLRVAELYGGSTGALLTARHCTRGHASVHICLSDVTPRSRATRRTSAGVGRQGRQQPGPASPLKGRSPRRSIRPPGSWVVSGGGWNRRLEAAGASTQVGLPWEC